MGSTASDFVFGTTYSMPLLLCLAAGCCRTVLSANCLGPCGMRRRFDGRYALVRDHLQPNPFAGYLRVLCPTTDETA